MSFKPISFFVPGVPATAGSKRAFINSVTGKAQVVDTCKHGPSWRTQVQDAARASCQALEGWSEAVPLLEGPLELRATFHFERPKHHFRTGRKAGQLRPGAPALWHTQRPDLTKCLRAVEDALTGVIWRDDAQIVRQIGMKVYGLRPGAAITIVAAPAAAHLVEM